MPLHALLYRRPSEPQTIEIAFDGSVYPVRLRRHRQARRYTLRIQAATREVILTIPPRGYAEGGARLRAEARRLDRGAARPAAGSRAVCRRRRRAAARRAAPHRASPRRARHGVDRDRRRTASGCYASPARRRTSTGASAISCAAKPSATWKPRACAMPTNSASPSGASPCAISRAAGAPARRPACCRFPGGSFWRRARCSIISPRTKWRISSR